MSNTTNPPAEVRACLTGDDPVDLIVVSMTMEKNRAQAADARHVPPDRLDPAAVVGKRLDKPEDPIYLICPSHMQSASACEVLRCAGFTQAVRIDIDQHSSITPSHGVSSIPDTRIWMDGTEVAGLEGFRTRGEIAAWIDQATATN